MNKEELIESGLLELYALEQCSTEEIQQVESLLEDSSVKAELANIEECLFSTAKSRSVLPRSEMKSKISDIIFETKSTVNNNETKGKEIALKNTSFTWRVAAGFMLLVSIGLFTIYNGKLRQMDSRITELAAEKQSVQENYIQVKQVSEELSSVEEFFAEKLIRSYELKHPNIKDEVFGVLYWCPTTGELMLNGMHMPKLSEKEQYQLWAIVDGKPLDLGVISKEWDGKTNKLAHLKGLKELSAYAITIEPLNGSKEPTLEKLTALAEV